MIARLSNTYLEVSKDRKDEVFLPFVSRLTQLGIIALGISALGKKRHRVEIARQLVFGSLVASFETGKHILCPTNQMRGNVLFRILDSTLPWWAERDTWGRWSTASSNATAPKVESKLCGASKFLCLASKDQLGHAIDSLPVLTLTDAIHSLAENTEKTDSQRRSRIIATYQFLFDLLTRFQTRTCSPQHSQVET